MYWMLGEFFKKLPWLSLFHSERVWEQFRTVVGRRNLKLKPVFSYRIEDWVSIFMHVEQHITGMLHITMHMQSHVYAHLISWDTFFHGGDLGFLLWPASKPPPLNNLSAYEIRLPPRQRNLTKSSKATNKYPDIPEANTTQINTPEIFGSPQGGPRQQNWKKNTSSSSQPAQPKGPFLASRRVAARAKARDSKHLFKWETKKRIVHTNQIFQKSSGVTHKPPIS